MSPVIDFGNVKALDPMPDGDYLAKVVFAEEGISTAGQPKVDLRWQIIAPEEHTNRQVFDIISFHPDALRTAKAKLLGMGFGEDFNGEITADMLMDREACITVTTEVSTQVDDDGNPYPPRNKVKKVRPASKYGTKADSASALEAMTIATPSKARPRKTE